MTHEIMTKNVYAPSFFLLKPEARCIKERSSGLRHSCEALLNATPAPTGALQVFLEHKKRRTRRLSHVT